MVSNRLMSSTGGGIGSGDGARPPHAERVSMAQDTRHSSAQLPRGSSLHTTTSEAVLIQAPKANTTNLLDLPIEVLEMIFTQLEYKNVSRLRMVNRHLNAVCSSILNSTFLKLQNEVLHSFQAFKARGESAQRSHLQTWEYHIIESLHIRLSLLQMTFGKHIERKHCCFFAAEILDEVYSILSYLKTETELPALYLVTGIEFFNLTLKAMKYFKEHIEPNVPKITYFGIDFYDITAFSPGESSKFSTCLDSPPPSGPASPAAADGGELAAEQHGAAQADTPHQEGHQQWAASWSAEASEEIAGGSKDSIAVDTPTEAAKPEPKPAKPEAKAAKTEAKSSKTEAKSDDAASTPPSRRRASADAAGSSHMPARKKCRLSRPRKL